MPILPLSFSECTDAKSLEAARRKFHEKVKRMRLETLRDPVVEFSASEGGDYALRLLNATGDLIKEAMASFSSPSAGIQDLADFSNELEQSAINTFWVALKEDLGLGYVSTVDLGEPWEEPGTNDRDIEAYVPAEIARIVTTAQLMRAQVMHQSSPGPSKADKRRALNGIVSGNLRFLATACGWSPEELAGEIGKDLANVQDHLRGSGMYVRTLKLYADTFGKKLGIPILAPQLQDPALQSSLTHPKLTPLK